MSCFKGGTSASHATTDNPTAIYYNPAGLALGEGTVLLVDATLAPGRYEAGWNGLTQRGTAAASGVYFYHLQTGSTGQMRPMLLAR